MRLGQLARQINISTDKIVSFLEKEKKITINPHPNAKIPDEHIDAITNNFVVIEDKITVNKNEKTATKAKEPPKKTKKETESEKPVIEKIKVVETISAVPTPKIIGKIDLPDKSKIEVNVDGVVYTEEELEQKKKEEREAIKAQKEQEAIEKAKQKKLAEEKKRIENEKRLAEQLRLKDLQDKEAKLLSVEEQNRRKEKEKKKADQEAIRKKKAKEAKKRFYEQQLKEIEKNKKVKQKTTAKKQEEEIVLPKQTVTIEEETPKSFWGKFLKWLNT
jgi:hypothetical protein